jgi:hypothetical protein
MFKKMLDWLNKSWQRMLFKSGRKFIRVTNLNAFSRQLSPGIVRLTFIAGPYDFVGYYVALRRRYSDKIISSIANDEIVLRSKSVSIAVGMKGGSAGQQVPTGEVSKHRVLVLLAIAPGIAAIHGGEMKLRSTLFKTLTRRSH